MPFALAGSSRASPRRARRNCRPGNAWRHRAARAHSPASGRQGHVGADAGVAADDQVHRAARAGQRLDALRHVEQHAGHERERVLARIEQQAGHSRPWSARACAARRSAQDLRADAARRRRRRRSRPRRAACSLRQRGGHDESPLPSLVSASSRGGCVTHELRVIDHLGALVLGTAGHRDRVLAVLRQVGGDVDELEAQSRPSSSAIARTRSRASSEARGDEGSTPIGISMATAISRNLPAQRQFGDEVVHESQTTSKEVPLVKVACARKCRRRAHSCAHSIATSDRGKLRIAVPRPRRHRASESAPGSRTYCTDGSTLSQPASSARYTSSTLVSAAVAGWPRKFCSGAIRRAACAHTQCRGPSHRRDANPTGARP